MTNSTVPPQTGLSRTGVPQGSATPLFDQRAVVYFGNDWFAENRTSSHHIAQRLAQRVPLLYVESPGLRAPSTSGRDLRKVFEKLALATKPPSQIGPQMWRMTMPQIPFRQLPFAASLNRQFGALLVKRALRSLSFERYLSWFVVPHPGVLAGRLGEAMAVYYCVDNYAEIPGMDREMVTRMDEDLTRRVQQVFVASPSLLESKLALNPNVQFSPHGVDVDLFQQAMDPQYEVAPAVRDISHPVVGFFGNLGKWHDYELLTYLAKARPHWTFLMVGLIVAVPDEFASLPNVVMPGAQPYKELPRWAKAFDVCVVPYQLSYHMVNSCSLKLREYLATGRPVVSISTSDTQRFAHCVHIAHSHEEFLGALDQAIYHDTEQDRQARLDTVRTLTWEARVEEVLQTVEKRLAAVL